jgi:hypothetical protein
MKSHLRARGASALVALGVVALASTGGAAASPDGGATAAKDLPNCTQARNIEAIIDDSGSMQSSDPFKFRTQLVDAFASIGSNQGRLFGGIEFGSTPNTLFGPGTLPGVITAMRASFAQVNANNNGTDYQQAFTAGLGHNGTADARIFITDGVPTNEPPNTTSHQNPRVKTYVVGLGGIALDPTAQSILARIASETGGPSPFLISQPQQVVSAAGQIAAAVACKEPPLTFTDTFLRQNQTITHSFKPGSKTVDVFTSWPSLGVTISQISFTQTVGGNVVKKGSVAVVAKKKKGGKRVKAKRTTGTTYATARLKGLKKKGKVKFTLKATSLPAPPTDVTTQIVK